MENKIVASKAAGTVEKVSAILHGQDDVVGYAYAINGRLQGAEVYGSGKLFRKLWPKLLHANAVEAVAELSSEKSQHTVSCTAVLDCLEDAEKGKALERDVTARIKLLWRETEGNILFETAIASNRGSGCTAPMSRKNSQRQESNAPCRGIPERCPTTNSFSETAYSCRHMLARRRHHNGTTIPASAAAFGRRIALPDARA